MGTLRIPEVRVAGLACAVPAQIATLDESFPSFGEVETRKIGASTGVQQRRIAGSLCTSDLAAAAAEKLIPQLGWPRSSIDALIFVSQTPDFLLPATACSLQERLKLSKNCAAFDVNLGCSGFVYGLLMASHLISGGRMKRLLLLVGDTISRIVSPKDRSVALLFGDAASATAIEWDPNSPDIAFSFGTDGTGNNHLAVPAGGFRRPHTIETQLRSRRDDGNIRSDEDLFMNGAEIFSFTLREVPPMIDSVLATARWSKEDVDAFVMHQANKFMLEHLAKRMKLPRDKVVISIEDRGNTSSASIPLSVNDTLAGRLRTASMQLVLAGFGVGYSWAAAALKCGPIVIPEVVVVESQNLVANVGVNF